VCCFLSFEALYLPSEFLLEARDYVAVTPKFNSLPEHFNFTTMFGRPEVTNRRLFTEIAYLLVALIAVSVLVLK
jgi:hypothetical protein